MAATNKIARRKESYKPSAESGAIFDLKSPELRTALSLFPIVLAGVFWAPVVPLATLSHEYFPIGLRSYAISLLLGAAALIMLAALLFYFWSTNKLNRREVLSLGLRGNLCGLFGGALSVMGILGLLVALGASRKFSVTDRGLLSIYTSLPMFGSIPGVLILKEFRGASPKVWRFTCSAAALQVISQLLMMVQAVSQVSQCQS